MKRLRVHTIPIGLAIWAMLLLAACAPPAAIQESPGIGADRPTSGRIFRHRWWNFYTRGLESADAGRLDAAMADLSSAVAQRERDQRMARTYGMHFLDYFPHRELGVIYWLTGRLEMAEAELSLSIAQAPSAKARYYLDRVREALIEKRGGVVPPPQLTLSSPVDGTWTRADHVTFQGVATDPNFVKAIRINGESLHLEGGQTTVDFCHDLPLPDGCHAILVEAVNLAGEKITRKRNVCVDRVGPVVVVDRIEPHGDGLHLSGSVLDPAGLATIDINGHPIPSDGAPEVTFSLRLPISSGGLTVECRDVLGNHSAFHAPLSSDTTRSHPPMLATLQLAGLFQLGDGQPPILRIQDWQDHQTVFMDKVVITGNVRDRDKVAVLTINGESILPRPGPLVFFSHIVELAPGANTVAIVAEDASGNRRARRMTIERKLPRCLLLEERLRLSIFAFEQKGSISAAGFAFQDDFIHEMVQRRRFRVVERQRLDLILQEQQINRTQLIDTDTALRLGHLVAAQAVVAGSLVETHTGIEIIGRVVDTETAEILCTVDVYGETKTLPGLKRLARALALKLHREFPLVDGLVVDKKGDLIITDLTLDQLRSQRRILIYAEQPVIHPETQKPMGMDHEVLCDARITQVDEHLSKARLKSQAHPAIRPLHRVITQ